MKKTEIFKGTSEELNKLYPEVITKKVNSWRNTDKHPCPKCGKQLGMPDYQCDECNIKFRLVMNF